MNTCEEIECLYLKHLNGDTYCDMPENGTCPLEMYDLPDIEDEEEAYERANDTMERAIARCEADYEGDIK